MFKKILLTLFLMFIPIFAVAMEGKDKDISSRRKVIIDPKLRKDGIDYELHFFWTTGLLFEDCMASVQITQVPIGGKKFFEKFQNYLTDLLEDSLAPLVRFVTDKLTLDTNPWLKTLKEKNSQRFFISLIQEVEDRLIQDVTKQIDEEFSKSRRSYILDWEKEWISRFCETISIPFSNAQKGNPAIASDSYRVLGMKSHHRSPLSPVVHLAYSDIDTFVTGLEEDASSYLKAIFQSPEPCKILRGRSSNDLISFEYNVSEGSDSWYEAFRMKILKRWHDDYGKHPRDDVLNFCSYFPFRYNKVRVITAETLREVIQGLSQYDFKTDSTIDFTGPGLLDSLYKDCDLTLCYPSVSSFLGNPLFELREANYLPYSTPELKNSLAEYLNLLEYGVVARKLGENHSSFLLLKSYIEAENPFSSQTYRDSLKEYIAEEKKRPQRMRKLYAERGNEFNEETMGDKTEDEIVKDYFKKLTDRGRFDDNFYPYLCYFLKTTFNIDFELTEEMLKTFLR